MYGVLNGKPGVPGKGCEELEVEDVELEGNALRQVYLLDDGVHQDAHGDRRDAFEGELEVAHYVRSYQLIGMVLNE